MTERMRFLRGTVAVASILVLAACSTRAPSPPPEPSRPAPAPAPLSPIHQDLDPLETVWHVRAGLNVAALSCAQRVGPGIVTEYNAFLKAKKALLAEAYAALSAEYRAKGGNWQRALDTDMTKLYNHFASPTAQAAFCDAAAVQVKRAIAATPDERQRWAEEALASLDRPFTGPQLAVAARGLMAMPAAEPAIPGGWRIQLGAFGSPAAAEKAWADIKSRSPELGSLSPHFEPVPGQSLTRLQVKGVSSRSEAITLCAHAAAAGFDCFPVKAAA
jgi:hypothetical protein